MLLKGDLVFHITCALPFFLLYAMSHYTIINLVYLSRWMAVNGFIIRVTIASHNDLSLMSFRTTIRVLFYWFRHRIHLGFVAQTNFL